jgi:hypothetical protein
MAPPAYVVDVPLSLTAGATPAGYLIVRKGRSESTILLNIRAM